MVIRKPRLAGVFVRALLITFVLTLLSFAVTLLLAIIGFALAGAARGFHPDMANAYRLIALPVAVVAAVVVLFIALLKEFRRYRQQLAAWRGF